MMQMNTFLLFAMSVISTLGEKDRLIISMVDGDGNVRNMAVLPDSMKDGTYHYKLGLSVIDPEDPFNYPIWVRDREGSQTQLVLPSTATVRRLRAEVAYQTGHPVDLFFGGRELVDEKKPLADLDIASEAVVDFRPCHVDVSFEIVRRKQDIQNEPMRTVRVPVRDRSMASFAETLRAKFFEVLDKMPQDPHINLQEWKQYLLLFPVNVKKEWMSSDLGKSLKPDLEKTDLNDVAFLGPLVTKCRVSVPDTYTEMMEIFNPIDIEFFSKGEFAVNFRIEVIEHS